MGSKVTIADLAAAKRQNCRIVAVSCYDHTTARLAAQAGVQMILVGDSAAQAVLGFDSTLPVTMDFMVAITAGVRRAAPNVYLVGDMPFLSYQTSVAEAVRNAGRFIVEGGAAMVKIEASEAYLDVIRAVDAAGMAVMAHIGIRPQTISKVGRLAAEATTADAAVELIVLAEQMVQSGASALLIEGAAAEVAAIITNRCDVPVIGCGSGRGCDGQILIAPDILGLTDGPGPKFAKSYANLGDSTVKAFARYCQQVRSGKYPDKAHSYHMKAGELAGLQKLLENRP
ncbi:MAG: 3-methyl-2-oxobutanoate hydroxymethyltransferase [Planctomycetota bacterium]|jgi:3-methyl-2-oxobutanoate hydroxymethyltransferase